MRASRTRRARLLGTGIAGPAALRLGVDRALAEVEKACRAALEEAGLGSDALGAVHAAVGLAGVGRKGALEAARCGSRIRSAPSSTSHDATIACIGAHGARDGGIVIVGTGSVGFAVVGGREIRVGGYGFPISDEGSGADLGLHAIRLALRAYDERAVGTSLTRDVMMRFHDDPFEAVAWMDRATATDYATFAPLVMRHADAGDPVARADRPRRRRADRRTGAPPVRMRRVPHRPARRARVVDAAVAGAGCPAPAGSGRGRCGGRRPASRPARRHEGQRSATVERSPRWQPRQAMRTEHISPRYVELDSWSAAEMIAAMYEGQLAAAAAVRGALGAIAAAVEDAVPALQRGGRIVYAGAGTSGRIGVQDGAELPPTFDWPADRLVFAMAGGLDALMRSAEGAEDNEDAGAQAMADAKIGAERRRHRHRGERHDALHDRRAAGGDAPRAR